MVKHILNLYLLLISGTIVCCQSGEIRSEKNTMTVNVIGRYETGIKNASATEVIAFDALGKKIFSTNSFDRSIDVIDISECALPVKAFSIDIKPYGNKANSISIKNGILAAAVEDTFPQRNGRVVLFDLDGKFISYFTVGSMPDMLTFTPDGNKIITANEGEPTENYSLDPEGSVSIIDLSKGIKKAEIHTISFADLKIQNGMKSFSIAQNLAADLEPEYITVSQNSATAWVVMQENNAIAEIDLVKYNITHLFGLGYKDNAKHGNGLDASDKNPFISINNWPIKSFYQPDAITSLQQKGKTYIITANEGDKRDYNVKEARRLSTLILDSIAFPDHANLKSENNLGRLLIAGLNGDTDLDGDLDELYAFGARSFSIWDTAGKLIFDSGDDFEQILADQYLNDPELRKRFKKRSDDRGPEPEGLTLANIGSEVYLFIGLERMGGVMMYKISDIQKPEFISYIQGNDFSDLIETNEDSETEPDLNPEGLLFIPAETSPIKKNMLLVANEVSGTITLYSISENK